MPAVFDIRECLPVMVANGDIPLLCFFDDLRDNTGRPITVGQMQAVDGQRRVFQCLQRRLSAIECQALAGMPGASDCSGMFTPTEKSSCCCSPHTTSGCHLCEHAEAILEQGGHRFQAVDIADDLSLMEQYGVRIPVVKDASGRELG